MKVQNDAVVSIEYTLRDDAGAVIDKSGGEPLSYLHGHGNIVPGLERKLEGMEAGASTRATVPPEEGYGERNEEAQFSVPRNELPDELEPKVGMMLSGQAQGGQAVPLWIAGVSDSAVELDANHPLAGRTLDFEVTVREVRAATAEELEHGHAHGATGHAH
ncbi:MAG TPA: peptidylprolyl isomerase [Myxococcales bacterium LLY-WYZ-16_1]|nr:peptidylprolyl isomerase [Myxococcales bacterium LLY-WYZ-16_1]